MQDGSNGGTNPGMSPGMGSGIPTPPNQVPDYTPPPPPPPPSFSPPPGPSEVNALTIEYWFKTHWKLLLLIIIGLLILGQTIFQIVYPSNRLTPNVVVDGVPLGGMKYEEAAKKLDGLYGELKLKIYFGKNEAAFQEPKMSEVGIGVDNKERLEQITYPFALRFLPGSIWWVHNLSSPGEIKYVYDRDKIASYTTSKVGEDCSIPPQNATLKLVDSKLQLVPSVAGGRCDITELQRALGEVKPNSDQNSPDNSVRVSINAKAAPITDDIARSLAAKLNSRLAVPMPIKVDNETDTIPGRVVLSWLDFVADVPEERIDNVASEFARLLFVVNQKRMEDYLNQGIASKLIIEPGVSKVSTLDFKETSRVNGKNGRMIDMPKAAQSVTDYINGKRDMAIGATKVVGPKVEYTRKYTPTSTGFSALLAQHAQDHPGTWSIAFQELSGVRYPRSATYRANAQMPAAGIHSLYMAYTYVMEEHAKRARPVDIITGDIDALECFKLMLQRFDYDCRTGFYEYFGHATLTAHARSLGLQNTIFAGEDTVTSANDLQKLFVGLYKNQIARLEGGQKILSTLRATRMNEGMPQGVASGTITHVTGEEGSVHNDAGIIYSTNRGAYALTILSKGAQWEDIVSLVKKIEALKAEPVPKDAR